MGPWSLVRFLTLQKTLKKKFRSNPDVCVYVRNTPVILSPETANLY